MPTRVAGSSRSSSTLLRREPFRTRLPVRSIGHAITGGPSLGISLGCSGTVLSLWIETSRSASLGRSFSGCADAGLAIARAATSRLTTDTPVRKLRLVSPYLHAAIGQPLTSETIRSGRTLAQETALLIRKRSAPCRIWRCPVSKGDCPTFANLSGAAASRSICPRTLVLPAIPGLPLDHLLHPLVRSLPSDERANRQIGEQEFLE